LSAAVFRLVPRAQNIRGGKRLEMSALILTTAAGFKSTTPGNIGMQVSSAPRNREKNQN
jgi:hypothetical protein